jgi:tetratricopeptide (TPR) repeat protein
MNRRAALIAGIALLLAVGGFAAWYGLAAPPPDADTADDAALPVPPIPPRIAGGLEYDRCLGLLTADPAEAASFAADWSNNGGGDGAVHCLALSRIALGEPDQGAAMLEALADTTAAPASGRGALLDQATQAWLMIGTADRAAADARKGLALLPEDPALLFDAARAASALGRYQDAADELDRALAREPRWTEALVLRGTALRHLGALGPARAAIDAALALDDTNAEALLERGILRQRANDPDGARADWERAVELAPDTPAADLARQNLALLEAGPSR